MSKDAVTTPRFAPFRMTAMVPVGLSSLVQDVRAVARRILIGETDRTRTQRAALAAFAVRILSAAIAYLSQVVLARWMGSFNGVTDAMTVEISNNDGASWTLVESVPGAPSGNWVAHSFAVQDFVAPTNQMRVRFNATDNPSDSVTEAGLDDFHVARVDCPALPDCNHNGILDADDIASGRSLDADFNGFPDECNLPTAGKTRSNPNPPGTAPDRSVP